MTHLQMMYYGLIPYLVTIAAGFFGMHVTVAVKTLLFLHSVNLLNWVCGYHWAMSMQSIQMQTKIACSILSILSLWATYTYIDGQQQMALYLMIALYLFQLYGDFRSDITYTVSPHFKLARILGTAVVIYSFLRVL